MVYLGLGQAGLLRRRNVAGTGTAGPMGGCGPAPRKRMPFVGSSPFYRTPSLRRTSGFPFVSTKKIRLHCNFASPSWLLSLAVPPSLNPEVTNSASADIQNQLEVATAELPNFEIALPLKPFPRAEQWLWKPSFRGSISYDSTVRLLDGRTLISPTRGRHQKPK